MSQIEGGNDTHVIPEVSGTKAPNPKKGGTEMHKV